MGATESKQFKGGGADDAPCLRACIVNILSPVVCILEIIRFFVGTILLTDLHSVYLEYLVAMTIKRCGISPHTRKIAKHFDQLLTSKHLNTADKKEQFEREGWSIVETLTLVDQHKIDPFLKDILTIIEVQNLLECSNNGEQLITVTRSCKAPYPQSWDLTLRPSLDPFNRHSFVFALRLQIGIDSLDSDLVIKKIEHEDFDIETFIQKMEMYKLFYSRN